MKISSEVSTQFMKIDLDFDASLIYMLSLKYLYATGLETNTRPLAKC